jgi:hypothetical protein
MVSQQTLRLSQLCEKCSDRPYTFTHRESQQYDSRFGGYSQQQLYKSMFYKSKLTYDRVLDVLLVFTGVSRAIWTIQKGKGKQKLLFDLRRLTKWIQFWLSYLYFTSALIDFWRWMFHLIFDFSSTNWWQSNVKKSASSHGHRLKLSRPSLKSVEICISKGKMQMRIAIYC